jgi:ATP/maltotriose-dependent transcriptional regulator MalT
MPLFLGLTNVMLARVYAEVNQIERSQELADAAAHHLSFMDSVIWSSIVNGLSARLALSVGKLDRARELLKPFSQPNQLLTENLWVMAYAGPALAELAFVQGEMERSKSVGDILIPRMDDEILSTYSAEMRYWRARAALALGDTTLAAMDLERARDVAANGKNRILLWRIHIEIAELAAAQGDSDKASHAVASARELITAIASCISNPILKESFLQRPDVRQIADASFSIINHQ